MAALARTASLDAWWFFLLCVGVHLELARCRFATNTLNGAVLFDVGVGKERGGSE